MIPRAVIFDLGKVLLDFDYTIALEAVARQSRATIPEIHHLLLEDTLLQRYESGRLDSLQFHEEFRSATGFRGDYAGFRALFADIFSPVESMIAFHGRLRARGVPTFIFSNTNEIAVTHIRERYPFFAGFDDYICSYEHGCMKPDAPLYQVVEDRSGCRGPELFYIDDRPENVATAARREWRSVVHESPSATFEAARAVGLPVD